jgi:hypothetical protein
MREANEGGLKPGVGSGLTPNKPRSGPCQDREVEGLTRDRNGPYNHGR